MDEIDLKQVFIKAPRDSYLNRKTIIAGTGYSRRYFEASCLENLPFKRCDCGLSKLHKKSDVLDWLDKKIPPSR